MTQHTEHTEDMMTDVILERCPFCGGKAALHANGYSQMADYRVECSVCYAAAYGSINHPDGAIKNWNRRAEPEPVPHYHGAGSDFIEHERRLDALAARLATLETLAASTPRAGDGYREIPAGERGEGWGRIPGPDLEAVTDMVYICEDGHNTRYPASVGKKYEWVRCWSGCVKRAYYAGHQFTATSP